MYSKRGSSLYGQPSWWTAPDEDAPLTLQPIHCTTKWTEANPTPVKGKSLSPAPPDTNKKRSASVKAYGTLPRDRSSSVKDRSSSVKDSKLTTRLIKKITSSSSKKASKSEGKASTSSSSASSASNSSSDLLKSTVARGTPKRETYIKKTTLNSRPRSAEVTSSSSSSSTTLQKPVTKFDRNSPQRHTYNKKEPTLSKKAHEESSSASKPEKKPRETIAELRQRMQQAKKAAADKETESDIQIFVPTKVTPTEPAADHVADDINSCNVVSSSWTSINDSDVQQISQRRQWEINEV